jgi:PAS domain S-box-containing protein
MVNILLIDDSSSDRVLAIHALKQEFDDLRVQEVTRLQDMEQVLEEGQFDLAITDYQLRWSDGLSVLRTLKRQDGDRPVIMFTASGTQEIAVEAMKSGLDDYVIKAPDHFMRLPMVARRVLEQVEARRRAMRFEARFQTLLNYLNVGVYRMQKDGVLLEGNPAFLRLLGLEPLTDLSSGQTLETHFHPQDYAELLKQLSQGEAGRDCEVLLHRVDGSKLWVKVSKQVTTTSNTIIIDGLIEDINERKQAEQALFSALENERMARAEAQKANAVKDEFLAIVSHEVRSPLNAIYGWAKMLRTQTLDLSTTEKALETIERNAKYQSRLIEDILDISRILQNQLRLELELVELIPVINTVIEDIQPLAQAKSIQLDFALDASVGQIRGDSARLQQVVWNLLSNAIKFTPEGGQVQLQLEQLNGLAQITVSDTGQGISPDFLPHVFDRFRQADSSITRSHKGLGLGLAIVYRLVEMHNGVVYATSDGIGQGSTFVVQLPIEVPHLIQPMQREITLPDEFSSLSDVQILVIDDDEDTRELLTFMLEQYEAKVISVGSATEVFQALETAKLDVLISDIGMPDEDGFSLIRRIRSLKSDSAQIPAIALTAFTRDIDEQEAAVAGFQHYLTKPVNPNELVMAIARLTR